MAIVVVIAGTWIGYQQVADSECSGAVNLTVTASPEIAPAVDNVAKQWSAAGAEVDGTCVQVTVAEEVSSTIAGAVSRDHAVTLVGLDTAPDAVQVPDVWIPDSSAWLMRLQQEAAGFLPSKVTSVAQSPLVLAAPEPIATKMGWPDKKIGWTELVGNFSAAEPLSVGIMDPTVDASGLTSLVAMNQATGNASPAALQAKTRALTAVSQNKFKLREELLAKFPKSIGELTNPDSVAIAPLSEEDVVAYNAQRPAVQLSAIYLEPSPAPLDYPYTIMPQVVDQQKSAAAEGLLKQLAESGAKDALAAVGLRAPDGTYGAAFNAPMGAPQASPAVTASATKAADGGAAAGGVTGAELSQVVGSWIALTKPGQALTVFDVSGSMGDPVPTAGGKTRAQVTQAAASVGLSLFSNKWSVGVWRFSTRLKGKQPWEQLVPIKSLATSRQEVQDSIGRLDPTNGGTGLYDTILDAYNHVKANYAQNKSNSVILFTDGENQNADGMTRPQLLSALKKAQDPKTPIRLVLIAVGPDVNLDELKEISGVVKGSGVFPAEDPTKITAIFAQAIGSRTGVS
ncbi:VWA domain-containing protein [Actinoplanes flavus]|uniref:Substrate-binding domain-containing protein n=1 Tax=Actinoplanes flavus TaxID=2820290 RepID=A0ABS3ULX1_9ACTN|nr:substrate-binding domain-containing protein [Actinoplanes flavus]MBO3739775.1 substrate-binding domain-containing protein [Actinoplanes flavus]